MADANFLSKTSDTNLETDKKSLLDPISFISPFEPQDINRFYCGEHYANHI